MRSNIAGLYTPFLQHSGDDIGVVNFMPYTVIVQHMHRDR
jgi:hypothetical protein